MVHRSASARAPFQQQVFSLPLSPVTTLETLPLNVLCLILERAGLEASVALSCVSLALRAKCGKAHHFWTLHFNLRWNKLSGPCPCGLPSEAVQGKENYPPSSNLVRPFSLLKNLEQCSIFSIHDARKVVRECLQNVSAEDLTKVLIARFIGGKKDQQSLLLLEEVAIHVNEGIPLLALFANAYLTEDQALKTRILISLGCKSRGLLQLSAVEIAKGFTEQEFSDFKRLKISLLKQYLEGSVDPSSTKAQRIKNILFRETVVGRWAITYVLNEEDLQTRVYVWEHLIEVTAEFYKLNNFNCATFFKHGLNCDNLQRLKKTKSAISPQHKQIFEGFLDVECWKAPHTHLGPCIPYIPGFLRDFERNHKDSTKMLDQLARMQKAVLELPASEYQRPRDRDRVLMGPEEQLQQSQKLEPVLSEEPKKRISKRAQLSPVSSPRIGFGKLRKTLSHSLLPTSAKEIATTESFVTIAGQSFPAGEVRLYELLGKGGTASIFRGCWKGLTCAVKVFLTNPEMGQFEMELLKSLKHPNIVEYIAHSQSATSYSIYMEFFMKTLNTTIFSRKKDELTFSGREILEFTQQIATGLAYLHDNSVMHLDIKSENIFHIEAQEGAILKIGDLGEAVVLRDQPNLRANVGTKEFRAPEVWADHATSKEGYDFKADVWSLGMVMFELLCLDVPYRTQCSNPFEYGKYIAKGRPQLPVEVIDRADRNKPLHDCTQIFNQLTMTQPLLRPTASGVVHSVAAKIKCSATSLL